MIPDQAQELREALDWQAEFEADIRCAAWDEGMEKAGIGLLNVICDAARTIALPILEEQFLVVPYCLTHESTTEPVWVLHVETGEPVKVEGTYREDCNLAMYDGRAGRCAFREFQLVSVDELVAALIPAEESR